MNFSTTQIRVCHLLPFNAEQVSLSLRGQPDDPEGSRLMSRFCASGGHPCTLAPSDVIDLIRAVERLMRHYRAACLSGVMRPIAHTLESLFFTFYWPIERCLNVYDEDCGCPWERRVADAEKMAPFIVEVARVHWSTGVESDFMAQELDNLASNAEWAAEHLAARDPRLAPRMHAVSTTLTGAAEDLRSGQWGNPDSL